MRHAAECGVRNHTISYNASTSGPQPNLRAQCCDICFATGAAICGVQQCRVKQAVSSIQLPACLLNPIIPCGTINSCKKGLDRSSTFLGQATGQAHSVPCYTLLGLTMHVRDVSYSFESQLISCCSFCQKLQCHSPVV